MAAISSPFCCGETSGARLGPARAARLRETLHTLPFSRRITAPEPTAAQCENGVKALPRCADRMAALRMFVWGAKTHKWRSATAQFLRDQSQSSQKIVRWSETEGDVADRATTGRTPPLAKAEANMAFCGAESSLPGDDMTFSRRAVFALPLALLAAPPPAEATIPNHRHHRRRSGYGSWDGRWVGAWGGSQPTVQIVKGGKLVAYEYNGQTYPVAESHVTPTKIVYGTEVLVTLTRTGVNTAHATIKTSQGSGTAELTRR
jgi:hypothetical protein